MCVVSSYDEGSVDPSAEVSDTSLGQSLGVAFEKSKPHTWCSNPFIERGKGNARTNCIGCHQHAGSHVSPDEVFKSMDPRFPDNGRSRMRSNFPSDYLWSFDDMPDFFQKKIIKAVNDFKEEDAED